MKPGLHEEVKAVSVIPPETVTATLTTYNGTTSAAASGIDIAGYDEAVCELHLGTMTGTLTVSLFDSATDDGDAAAVVTDIDGNEAAFDTLGSGTDDVVKIIRIKAKDVKRYLFVKVVNADDDSKTFGITMWLGDADSESVSQEQTVDFDHSNG